MKLDDIVDQHTATQRDVYLMMTADRTQAFSLIVAQANEVLVK